ncbi:hypothetical protein QBC43DRAFT_284166 [Cladorrhinum sp. PSN259]|nr:hypothetical protein QBC43DRAFT_284166 [Cladorrhinum sp. PSN259]
MLRKRPEEGGMSSLPPEPPSLPRDLRGPPGPPEVISDRIVWTPRRVCADCGSVTRPYLRHFCRLWGLNYCSGCTVSARMHIENDCLWCLNKDRYKDELDLTQISEDEYDAMVVELEDYKQDGRPQFPTPAERIEFEIPLPIMIPPEPGVGSLTTFVRHLCKYVHDPNVMLVEHRNMRKLWIRNIHEFEEKWLNGGVWVGRVQVVDVGEVLFDFTIRMAVYGFMRRLENGGMGTLFWDFRNKLGDLMGEYSERGSVVEQIRESGFT